MGWKLNQPKTRQRLAAVGIGIVMLIAGYIILTPRQTRTQPQTIDVTIIIKNNKRVSGPSSIIARQGDKININLKTDRPDEFHLHGYDHKIELKADKKAALSFTAELSGQFDYELENAGLQLGRLQIDPT